MSKLVIEKSLIERIKQLDEKAALTELYLIIAPKTIGYVINHEGSKEDGEDTAHNVILKIYTILKTNQYEEQGLLSAYVWQIIKNTWNMEFRLGGLKSQRHQPLDAIFDRQDSNQNPDEFDSELIRNQIYGILYDVKSQLSTICQVVLEMWSKNEKYERIAEKLGITVGNARIQKKRCFDRLKEEVMKRLGRDGEDYVDYLFD